MIGENELGSYGIRSCEYLTWIFGTACAEPRLSKLMKNMNNILDIDLLREHNKRLYYFGLGFIQLVLNKRERLHFYNVNLDSDKTNDEIHNHRYNFISKVLKGALMEKRYRLTEGNTHILVNESCTSDSNKSIPMIEIPLGVELYMINNYTDKYHIYYNEFHNVDYAGNTITHLTRSDIITEYAQVLYENNKEKVYSFSNKMGEDMMWEIIEDTIKNE